MDFEVHCMSILHTKLSFFNYDKVKSVLQSITPKKVKMFNSLTSSKQLSNTSLFVNFPLFLLPYIYSSSRLFLPAWQLGPLLRA